MTRTVHMKVRLTPAEREELQAAADAGGRKLGDYVRWMSLLAARAAAAKREEKERG